MRLYALSIRTNRLEEWDKIKLMDKIVEILEKVFLMISSMYQD